MFLFDGSREDDDVAGTAWNERKAASSRPYVRQRSKCGPQPADLNAQSGAMRVVDVPRAEGSFEEGVPRRIFWPRLPQRSGERK